MSKLVKLNKDNIGEEIKYINIFIYKHKPIKVEIEKHKILGVSDSYICLDNEYFTQLANSTTFNFCHPYLEEIRISDKPLTTYDEDKINCWVYTQKSLNTIEKKIKLKIKQFIEKNYWYLERTNILEDFSLTK